MPRIPNDARTRWLLTLGALGGAAACSPPPVGMDANTPVDATSDRGMTVDDRAVTPDAPALDAMMMGTDAVVTPDSAPMPDGTAGGDGAMMGGDGAVGPYPAGPYGTMEGQVLENLMLQGYVNPEGTALSNTLPFGPTDLQALRNTGRRYALVHTSAFY